MIFSNTQIKTKTILVRFYFYSDSERGYGDAGTAKYFKMKLEDFSMVENSRFGGGGKFYTYKLTDEAYGKIQKVLGKSWGYGIGYEMRTGKYRQEEIIKLRAKLEAAEVVESI
jgi:hypothetical protein